MIKKLKISWRRTDAGRGHGVRGAPPPMDHGMSRAAQRDVEGDAFRGGGVRAATRAVRALPAVTADMYLTGC